MLQTTNSALHLTNILFLFLSVIKTCQITVALRYSHFCFCPLLAFNTDSHLSRVCLNPTGGEIRSIIGIEQVAVIVLGITLWKQERLGGTSNTINIRKIYFGVEPILASACKEKPSAICAPVMKTLSPVTINFFHLACFTSL